MELRSCRYVIQKTVKVFTYAVLVVFILERLIGNLNCCRIFRTYMRLLDANMKLVHAIMTLASLVLLAQRSRQPPQETHPHFSTAIFVIEIVYTASRFYTIVGASMGRWSRVIFTDYLFCVAPGDVGLDDYGMKLVIFIDAAVVAFVHFVSECCVIYYLSAVEGFRRYLSTERKYLTGVVSDFDARMETITSEMSRVLYKVIDVHAQIQKAFGNIVFVWMAEQFVYNIVMLRQGILMAVAVADDEFSFAAIYGVPLVHYVWTLILIHSSGNNVGDEMSMITRALHRAAQRFPDSKLPLLLTSVRELNLSANAGSAFYLDRSSGFTAITTVLMYAIVLYELTQRNEPKLWHQATKL